MTWNEFISCGYDHYNISTLYYNDLEINIRVLSFEVSTDHNMDSISYLVNLDYNGEINYDIIRQMGNLSSAIGSINIKSLPYFKLKGDKIHCYIDSIDVSSPVSSHTTVGGFTGYIEPMSNDCQISFLVSSIFFDNNERIKITEEEFNHIEFLKRKRVRRYEILDI